MHKIISLSLLVAMGLSGCSKESGEELAVSPGSITVYAEETAQLVPSVEEATYQSQDSFYASVSETGLVTGKKVGRTEILISSAIGKASVPVTVLNRYALYPDIDGLIGDDEAAMTRVMGNYYVASDYTPEYTEYTYEKPTEEVESIVFAFSAGHCVSIGLLLPVSCMEVLSAHLLERYSYAGIQNDMHFYTNHDRSVVITVSALDASHLMVTYLPHTDA